MDRLKVFSSTSVKSIAILMMLIDHFAATILYSLIVDRGYKEYADLYYFCRYIGRVAFPIFCYILVEGFIHTKNLEKYIKRMLLFAFISEVPFDMAIKGVFLEFSHQNVFFTLALGLIAIWFIEYSFNNFRYDDPIRIAGAWCGVSICCAITYYAKTDYALIGVIIVVLIYLFRNAPVIPCFIGPVLLIVWEYIKYYGENRTRYFEIASFLAVPILLMYNGKRGHLKIKWLFYIIYPLHLFIIGLVRMRYFNG